MLTYYNFNFYLVDALCAYLGCDCYTNRACVFVVTHQKALLVVTFESMPKAMRKQNGGRIFNHFKVTKKSIYKT